MPKSLADIQAERAGMARMGRLEAMQKVLRAFQARAGSGLDRTMEEMERGGAVPVPVPAAAGVGGPSSEIAERKQREIDERRRQGPPAEMLRRHYRR